MKKLFFTACAIAVLASCSTPSFVVKKVETSDNLANKGRLFYQLPLTTFQIIVEEAHTVFVPGPYYMYASRYLGIEGAASTRTETCDVSVIKVNVVSVPDPQSMFSVTVSGNAPVAAPFRKLTETGYVIDPLESNKVTSLATDLQVAKSAVPDFIDLSVEDFQGEKIDTLFKTVFRDSGFVRVPITKKVVLAKDADDKAREAASLITKLRKRRAKMVSWQYTNVNPSGDAMRTSLEEMKRIEAEYLSLFIGRTVVEKQRKVFYITPSSNQRTMQAEVCRFDDTCGIVAPGKQAAKALYFKLNTTTDKQKFFTQGKDPVQADKQVKNSFYVRMPENAEISILNGNTELYKANCAVFQLGTIVPYWVTQ